MKKMWVLIGGFILGAPIRAMADATGTDTPPKVDVSTAPPASPAPAAVSHPGLNQMRGKLLEKSYDPRSLRLTVDGGVNVEFTWDSKTAVVNGGSSISIDDLNYNDELIIWYSGMELYAIDIDRVSKAPRPE